MTTLFLILLLFTLQGFCATLRYYKGSYPWICLLLVISIQRIGFDTCMKNLPTNSQPIIFCTVFGISKSQYYISVLWKNALPFCAPVQLWHWSMWHKSHFSTKNSIHRMLGVPTKGNQLQQAATFAFFTFAHFCLWGGMNIMSRPPSFTLKSPLIAQWTAKPLRWNLSENQESTPLQATKTCLIVS